MVTETSRTSLALSKTPHPQRRATKARHATRLASFICLMAGTALGMVFGTVVSSTLGYTNVTIASEEVPDPGRSNAPAPVTLQSSAANSDVVESIHDPSVSADAPAYNRLEAVSPRPVVGGGVAALHQEVSKPSPAIKRDPVSPMLISESATDEKPATLAGYRIEGDATVVEFDSDARTIEVRDGRAFALAQTGSGTDGALWQDYVGNVHYTCDQGGSCTLYRAGNVISTAKIVAT